ncbi:hypothetical protein KBC59_03560 [Patescibacteria group bacterium]|jgi:hypothetical protein|nr:hypothetical protein [Patescibacteria group bacterium]
MMMPGSQLSRKLPTIVQTHRASTLNAISQKTHNVTARIEFLKAEGQRMSELLDQVPEDTGSRLAWLSSRLHAE